MTKQEAVEKLKDKAYLFHGEGVKALSMAIEALEQEQTAEYSSDVSIIQATSAKVTKMRIDEPCSEWGKGWNEAIGFVIGYYLSYVPSAERHSAWLHCEDEAGHDGFRCEKCDTFYPCYYEYYHSAEDFISDYNFCPNCGAKMETEQ